MNWNNIWAVIEPYVLTVIGALGGGVGVFALCRFFLSKTLNKLTEKYKQSDIADGVAQRLAGKTLNIDVTAITERALKKLEKQINEKVENIQADTSSYKHLLALIGNAMSKLKAITKEEKEALEIAVKALESDYVPVEPEEILTVKLEPVILEPERKEEKETDGRLIHIN